MPYEYHTDPGHGWLAVPDVELALLGLSGSISGYSYQRGSVVYLEEDCDMSKFLEAKLALAGLGGTERLAAVGEWWRKHVIPVDHAQDCFVRRLARYQGR